MRIYLEVTEQPIELKLYSGVHFHLKALFGCLMTSAKCALSSFTERWPSAF